MVCNVVPECAGVTIVIMFVIARVVAGGGGGGGASSVCLQHPREQPPHDAPPSEVVFQNIAFEAGFRSRQSNVRTSPNCLFPQWDETLRTWDAGGFCMEETLTGGACIGDANGDGNDDLYYPRMDGGDILYINRGDGTGFDDMTAEANLTMWEHVRSNGCQFVDIDNDGDNDLYVSTLGSDRFYLFVNHGGGRFEEEAVQRGLENIVRNGTRMTAGFTIAVADIDNDGDLDIATTEWMPWLDGEDMNSDSARAFLEATTDASSLWTNARLYENMGPGARLGHFKDITVHAGVMPKFRLQQRRPDFTSYACKHVGPRSLAALLQGVGLAAERDEPEDSLREKFLLFRESMRHASTTVHTMDVTTDARNTSQYTYFKAGGQELGSAKKLYVTVVSLDASSESGDVKLFAAGRSNPQPTALPKRNHEWKTVSGRPLVLDVGGAYGGRTFYLGVSCHRPTGCAFELSVLTSDSDRLVDDVCGDGSSDPVLEKSAGPFKVELVVPWMTSERFVQYSLRRMNEMKFGLGAQRKVIRDLMQTSDKRDVERYARISRTQVRLQRAVQNSKKWVLTDASGSSESSWLQALTGVNQGGVAGKKRMNHATEFPLVGAFQFAAKFTDLDSDGYADLIISGDFGTSQMYWGNGNGTFRPGFFNLIEDSFDNSMGATVGDWDLDGLQDVLFTSTSISDTDLKTLNSVASTAGLLLSFRGNHLYRYVGGRRFEDVTDATGVRESGWGWGAFFFDFDNDGDLDALNGNGMDDPETTDDDWAVQQPMRLYVNQGREQQFRFEEEAKVRNIASTAENRAALAWDFDNDGDLDVFVVNHGDMPQMYRNEGGHYYDWLRVKVVEPSGRESIGSKVWLYLADGTVLVREIGSSSAFLGQSESVAHFGLGVLGSRTVERVDIWWLRHDTNTTLWHVPIRNTVVVSRRESGPYNIANVSRTAPVCVFPTPTRLHTSRKQTRVPKEAPAPKRAAAGAAAAAGATTKTTLQELQGRYRRAARFFEAKMANVDEVVLTAANKGLSDAKVLELLDKKYPFIKNV
jgi:hypothetical protein